MKALVKTGFISAAILGALAFSPAQGANFTGPMMVGHPMTTSTSSSTSSSSSIQMRSFNNNFVSHSSSSQSSGQSDSGSGQNSSSQTTVTFTGPTGVSVGHPMSDGHFEEHNAVAVNGRAPEHHVVMLNSFDSMRHPDFTLSNFDPRMHMHGNVSEDHHVHFAMNGGHMDGDNDHHDMRRDPGHDMDRDHDGDHDQMARNDHNFHHDGHDGDHDRDDVVHHENHDGHDHDDMASNGDHDGNHGMNHDGHDGFDRHPGMSHPDGDHDRDDMPHHNEGHAWHHEEMTANSGSWEESADAGGN